MSRRFRALTALLLALILAFTLVGAAACTPKEDDGGDKGTEEPKGDEPVKGGTLNYYINEPAFIDPVNAQESEGIQVVQSVFDSLVDFDPKTSELLAAAAESWEPNEDGTVWTFKLKQGAKFHNGTEVKAADFKYAWERICNPDNASEISYHLAAVKGYQEMQNKKATELSGVVAKDDNTLEVTLTYPFADFEYVVGHPALGPVPKAEVDKDPKAFAEKPVGNGPFMMAEPWKHDQYVKVVRFEDYDEPALLDGIDFKIFKDEETAFLEFKAGNVDFTSIPSGQVGATKGEYGESDDGYEVAPEKQVLLGPELSMYYIVINGKKDVLNNADVRRAMSLAINRKAISETVYEGVRTPAEGIIPEGITGFQSGDWPYVVPEPDIEQAKELLTKAGYPEGKGIPELGLAFNAGSGHEDVMQLVQADLAKIGVKVKLDGMEWAQVLDKYDAGDFDLGRLGWLADYPIMDNYLYPLFTTDSADNHSFYSNKKVDDDILAARKITDGDERIEAYREIDKTIGADAPVIPIVAYRHRHVGSARMRDFVYSPMGLASLDKVWIAADAE